MRAKFDRPAHHVDASQERALIAETLLSSAARLISGRTEREIVMGICDALTRTTPRIRLAWTWFGPQETPLIQPQIYSGPATAYARNISIKRSLLTQIGPVFTVLDGQPAEAFNISPWSLYGPWRQLATEYGIRNVLALPVHSRFSGYGGVFVLYADTEDYFNRVGTSLFSALASLFSSVLTASSERVDIEHSAHHDALTGLLNRHALSRIEPRLLRASEADPPACVLLLDLDNFKRINDQAGHTTGDRVLQAAARTLQQTVRAQDSVVRWGGEEFLICLPRTNLQEGHQAAEKLRGAIAALTDPLPVTVSIGLTELLPKQNIGQAADRADVGLLLAKEGGRNRVCVAP